MGAFQRRTQQIQCQGPGEGERRRGCDSGLTDIIGIMYQEEKKTGHTWFTWLAVWCQVGMSTMTILLYVILLDIAPVNIKPRPLLENVNVGFIYTAHIGNIVAAICLACALMQEIDGMMVLWIVWSIIYIIFQIVLIVLTSLSIFERFAV